MVDFVLIAELIKLRVTLRDVILLSVLELGAIFVTAISSDVILPEF